MASRPYPRGFHRGRPAVHCCLKKKGDRQLILAVNAVCSFVEALIKPDVPPALLSRENEGIKDTGKPLAVTEVFSGRAYPVIGGGFRSRFGPYEAKAFLF